MEKTVAVDKGEILLKENILLIHDQAGKHNRERLLSASLWMLFGVFSFLRYLKTGDEFLLWSGILIGIGHLAVLILTLFRSSDKEVAHADIRLVVFKQRFGRKFIDLKLRNSKTRRISSTGTAQAQLRDYFIKKGFPVK